MRSVFMMALVLGLAPIAASAAPVAAPPPGASANVTLDLANVPLRTALQDLFAGSGQQYAVAPDVPNYPITLDIRNVSLSTALPTLLRLAPGVVYRKEGDVYVIGMRAPEAAVARQAAAGTIELEVPAAGAKPLHIEGENVVGDAHQVRLSGNVLITFADGVRLQTHGVPVTVERDTATGVTRILITPLPSTPAP